MTITLVEYHPEYIIPDSGKYLVRTISNGPLRTIGYLEARCLKIWDEKRQSFRTSIDVNNQTVTHISTLSL